MAGTRKWWQRVVAAWTQAPPRGRRPARRRSALLQIEPLENRLVPSNLIVTTSSDALSHTGTSLRDALALANTDAATGVSDTITFASSLSGQTVTLVQGGLTLSASNGTTTGTGTITIDGSETTPVTVSGANSYGLTVNAGVTAVLKNLTLIDAYNNSLTFDAGINNSGTLTMTGVTVSATLQGAINNVSGGTTTMTSCSLVNSLCTANTIGGGLYLDSGTVTISDSTISGNSCTDGGGLYDAGGTLIVTDTTVSSNAAGDSGGGFYIASGTVTLAGDTIATNSAASGGGIYQTGGTLIVQADSQGTATTINGNTTTGNGGGLDLVVGTATITGGSIKNNVAAVAGGGIADMGSLTITDASLTGNTSTQKSGTAAVGGGALWISSYQNTTLTGCAISANVAGSTGGGIDLEAGNLIVDSTTIGGTSTAAANSAVNGGGIYSAGTLTVQNNSLIDGNVATSSGGGIDVAGGNLTVSGGTISSNTASKGGGGIYFDGGGSLTLQPGSLGGVTVSGNQDHNNGAGINLNSGTATLSDVTLQGNTENGTFGGGVYNNATMELADCTLFANSTAPNTAGGGGGGIFNAGTLTALDCTLSGNTSAVNGGGFREGGTASLINCTITANVATNSGGGVFNPAGATTLVHCTIAGNTAGAAGGGVSSSGQVTLFNVIVAGNTCSNGSDVKGAVTGNNNLIGNGTGMSGLVNGTSGNEVGTASSPLNPLLGPLASNGGPTQTMLLLSGSPAGGAGGAVSQVTVAIAATDMSITVANASAFAAFSAPTLATGSYGTIQIDAEQMAVTGVTVNADGTATLTVTRGANSTTPAGHSVLTSVFLVSDQRGILPSYQNPAAVNIGAVENALPTLSFITQPGNTTTGNSIGSVTVQELTGNTPDAGTVITIGISAPGQLTGTLTATTNASGNATFSTLAAAVAGTFTLSASVGSVTATSASFTVAAPTLTTLAFTLQPISEVAGSGPIPTVVQARDQLGFPMPNVPLTFSIAPGTLTGPTAATTGALGQATYTLAGTSAGTYVLTATQTAGTVSTASKPFVIAPAALAALSFVQEPGNVLAGATLNAVAVLATDKFGNAVPGTKITLTPSAGALAGTTSVTTDATGTATFTTLSLAKPGTYTLTARTGTLSALSTSFVVSPGAVAKLSFTTEPVSTTAGSIMKPVVVKASDQFGNAIPGTPITISISSGTLNGLLTATTNAAGLATFSGLSDTVAGTYTLTAATGSITGLSTPFAITAGAVTVLSFVTQPVSTTAGSILSAVVIQASDQFGNVVPSTAIAIGNVAGKLNGTLSALTNAAGQASFKNLSESVVGTYTLIARKGTISTTSNPFVITAGNVAAMAFIKQPLNTAVGSTLNAVTVLVKDRFGNVVSGVAIGIALSKGSLAAGTTPVTTDATGTAVFSDLIIDTVGTYALLASTSGLARVSSHAFLITAGAPAALTFLTQPRGTTAGATLSPFLVAVVDAFGNIVPGAGRIIMLSENGMTTGPYKTNVNGEAVIANWSESAASSHTLTALSSVPTPVTAATSQSYSITPGRGVIHFLVGPESTPAGTDFGSVSVIVTDAFGNLLTNSVVVYLRLSVGTISGGVTAVTTNASGVATFDPLIENVAGHYTLIAWSTGLTAVVSSPFTIS